MKSNASYPTLCYTWNGKGNLGDDWIAEVSQQYFASPVGVYEKRSLNPLRLGKHRLETVSGETVKGELVLWGGGWIASDRPSSRTLRAWSRHVQGQLTAISGFGLGIGPFLSLSSQQAEQLSTLFSAFEGKLGVRTFADLDHVPQPFAALVGCDVALLDRRFLDTRQHSVRDSEYVVFSFPGYSSHWALTRPWLTEEWYASTIRDLAARISASRRIVFVEFDQVVGRVSDSDYWTGLPCTVARPTSIEEAALLFRNASQVYAGRLHAAILGSVLGVPTLAFAYHHKFEVVAELGIPTVGLTAPSPTLPKPVEADLSILDAVRQRGLDVLSSVRTDG